MKLLRSLTLVCAALTATVASADKVKVSFSAEPYPPFYSVDASGTWKGWEVDIIDAVCESAKLECEYTPVAWDGLIPALQSKKIDVIMSSMSITAERAKVVDFSDRYYRSPAVILAAKGTNITEDPASLNDKILGVQSGTIHRKYALKYFKDSLSSLKEYQTQDEVIQDLLAGRIDALQADSISLLDFINSKEGQSCCNSVSVKEDLEIMGPGIGAALRKNDGELKGKINKAIASILENGKYKEISDKYFSFDPYGG